MSGTVNLFVDSCLFTPTNANYSHDYVLYTGSNGTQNANCFDKILSDDHNTTFSLGFNDLEDCGWEWSNSYDGTKLKVSKLEVLFWDPFLQGPFLAPFLENFG